MTPKTAVRRHDLAMTYNEFNLAFNQTGFIGLRCFTPVGVAQQSAEFARVKVRSLLDPPADTRRAPGASYKRTSYEWDVDAYSTHEHGAEEPVDDRTVAMYGDILRTEQIATERAINIILQQYEAQVATAAQDETVIPTSPAAQAWTIKASADPIADIDNAKEAVRNQIGMPANALVLSDWALLALIRTTRVEDLLKYSGVDDPKNLQNLDGLRSLLKLEYILVGWGMKIGGNAPTDIDVAASFSRHWDDTKATVCRISPSSDLQDPNPCLGRTIMWSEENAAMPGAGSTTPTVIVEEYRAEDVRGSVIRARMDYQVKTIHADAGHVLTGVTA